MTKQEAIEKTRALLAALEALPDGVDILSGEVNDFTVINEMEIHLNSGIELVSKSLGLPICPRTPEDSKYIHREIVAKNCEYVQLDEKAAPGVTSTGDGTAEQSSTHNTTIITAGKEEVKP